jgi:hypothetical protein
MPYTPATWIDDDGTNTVGTTVSAARMNAIEQALAAASSGMGTTVDFAWPLPLDLGSRTPVGADGNATSGRALLVNQTIPTDNGIWDYAQFPTPTWTKASDNATLQPGQRITVLGGDVWAGSVWQMKRSGTRKFTICGGQSPMHHVGDAGQIGYEHSWVPAVGGVYWYLNTGRLYLSGAAGGGLSGQSAFTLPSSVAPAVQEYSIALGDAGGTPTNFVVFNGDGTVVPTRSTANVFFSAANSFLIAGTY